MDVGAGHLLLGHIWALWDTHACARPPAHPPVNPPPIEHPQVLLEEEDGAGGYRPVQRAPNHGVWAEVAGLLSRKRDAIPPLQALGLLPGEARALLGGGRMAGWLAGWRSGARR